MRKHFHNYSIISIIIIFLLIYTGCTTVQQKDQSVIIHSTSVQGLETHGKISVDPAIQVERDEIYALLAYAVVLKDWQSDDTKQKRGHNIGSVLVNEQGEVVFWARNANSITLNGTQHGEVRLIRNYLDHVKSYNLKGYTVYTTLEPCAMCSGMMVMTNIARTVYGQTDPDFGKALERLSLDTHNLPNGFKSYPRPVISEPSQLIIRQRLDIAYKRYQESGGKGLTTWLLSLEAKAIYEEALKMFFNYKIKYLENTATLEKAKKFYAGVPSVYVPLPQ